MFGTTSPQGNGKNGFGQALLGFFDSSSNRSEEFQTKTFLGFVYLIYLYSLIIPSPPDQQLDQGELDEVYYTDDDAVGL